MSSAIAEAREIFSERKNHSLIGYHKSDFDISVMPEMRLNERLFIASKKIPMWDFVDFIKLKSTKPIGVIIRNGEELILAENETLGIYAYGESEQEAIRDFTDQLIEYYEHYMKTDDSKLTEKALETKKLYSKIFKVII